MAISKGWVAPLLTVGLFVSLELASNNVLEPWLYGKTTGVSAVAVLVAAISWMWLWGPIGLLLATPRESSRGRALHEGIVELKVA